LKFNRFFPQFIGTHFCQSILPSKNVLNIGCPFTAKKVIASISPTPDFLTRAQPFQQKLLGLKMVQKISENCKPVIFVREFRKIIYSIFGLTSL
jgi:hypothetical protein